MSIHHEFAGFQQDYPHLYTCLAAYFPDTDGLSDADILADFAADTDPEEIALACAEAHRLLLDDQALDLLGPIANRSFQDRDDAAAWLRHLMQLLADTLPKS